jgi:hypothetical protein
MVVWLVGLNAAGCCVGRGLGSCPHCTLVVVSIPPLSAVVTVMVVVMMVDMLLLQSIRHTQGLSEVPNEDAVAKGTRVLAVRRVDAVLVERWDIDDAMRSLRKDGYAAPQFYVISHLFGAGLVHPREGGDCWFGWCW